MSFQAVTWAIEQRTGSPSAKATLWSLANYANENWFAYPKQETIATDSEQSTDSVGKRIADLIGMGLVRRIKLKRFGRRTHDFLILKPSPYFAASIEELRRFLPSSCDVFEDEPGLDLAAADCGSDKNDSLPAPSEDSENHAAADSGSVSSATLPQSAVDATALVRQHKEPVIEPDSQPQTPSHSAASPQASETDSQLEAFINQFRETYPRPSSKPEFDRGLCAALSERQRDQVLHGARGARSIFDRNPKNSGVVGPTRFLQSEPLWAEYGRYAPSLKAPPPPRVFVANGSEEWHARTVLCAIVAQPMPTPKFDGKHGCEGADFLGHLPPGGLALAQFVGQFGTIDPDNWVLLDRDINREQIGAWRERIRECTGREIELQRILRRTETRMIDGRERPWNVYTLGLRVPQPFPPAKGTSSTGPPGESSAA